MLLVEAEDESSSGRASELQAVHRQADRAIGVVAAIDAWNRGNTLDPIQDLGRAFREWAAAGIDAGIEIGVIARVDGFFGAIRKVHEDGAGSR